MSSRRGKKINPAKNAGDYAGAANEFPKWDHAAGRVLAGLLKRRTEEENEFNTGDING